MTALTEPYQATTLLPASTGDKGCKWVAQFKNTELRSAFQPIYSLSHQRVIGYEALVRPFNSLGDALSPQVLFNQPVNEAENLKLDRLCRYLHLKNFSALEDDINWLFINVSPTTIDANNTYDSFFGKLMDRLNFDPNRVVVEIIEHASTDTQQLTDSVAYYKKLGCLTAIDDFGAGHSNFERIWTLKPDIVKLDRTMIVRAHNDKRIQQMMKGIVSLLHEAGCLVLMEGVETRDQAMIALDSDVDFVQGFYFATPQLPLQREQNDCDLPSLMKQYKLLREQNENPRHKIIKHFSSLFNETVRALEQNLSFRKSAASLTKEPSVSRCYLIDKEGFQIGDILTNPFMRDWDNPKYRPLKNTVDADWYHCHYLRNAIDHPETLQVTQPYPSTAAGAMCVTLSRQFEVQGLQLILCCDIFAESLPH